MTLGEIFHKAAVFVYDVSFYVGIVVLVVAVIFFFKKKTAWGFAAFVVALILFGFPKPAESGSDSQAPQFQLK